MAPLKRTATGNFYFMTSGATFALATSYDQINGIIKGDDWIINYYENGIHQYIMFSFDYVNVQAENKFEMIKPGQYVLVEGKTIQYDPSRLYNIST